ncbi:type II toxin-antitoxin system RelB/DinJ family antitoxin [Treponema sp.]|uniref:type II toxin-antitoxin system RelB/DinJ family antitoxin n=1 Tax=Treponema sp. TaxID=166 RepID=UPI003FD72B72
MATAVLQTRVDSALKKQADSFFASLGMDTTTAIRLFLKQAINQNRIPFDIVPPQQEEFSAETMAAMEEARNVSRDKKPRSFSSAKDLLEDCFN